ncbi:putative hydrolase protein [Eutypa lata UCREL1]|uniref:Putative hydrolase protein n=1 Tax=Eutypa lata (strain UCR-EL1) TaxID=1287681 RepID=M7TD04_EUTLA|nr:putative hydrolase protein [Eutypa lata UCREL1]
MGLVHLLVGLALKITKFSILAHSAGAIYALATALRMPQHIRGRIHLLAPWIPPSQLNTFATSSSITSSLPKEKSRRAKRKTAAKDGRDTASNRKEMALAMEKENLAQDPTGFPESMDPLRANGGSARDNLDPKQSAIVAAASDAIADKERQMTYDMRLTHAIWDLATTGANPAVDLLVCLERRHTIGFRYVDITRPVVIRHGTRDTRVPVDNVRWLGKTMRRCEVRVLEGEGHGLMASASVMGSVLMEIAKEWDDWNRVTKGNRSNDV